ncbi:helix-turn-helix domain-containing protein [Clostridium estertheticum]|uniref:Transcriptional regulator n=1 Tax=Clostridium estertheticum subsp. estertheticum TaxID=1552 RepID=A0A1J0GKK5_9CLOT|nr:helix-turn-helix transcriptional regulator [Clostridium estertheticum]APC41877.1 transcriptional regulator [Clostridium estertheticum subsp. estertheticum]MBU3073274.1 helix-turn-helix transcriptional regulator [Clostridium estertheticum]MBU3163485.1 helix-turn-helix transcriptional regulator [Clostridium estertheticum]MBU3173222.1 helix-turn-helix transcriptional regulator [Clostridium estertheticum]MBZ9616224.1 helix-turn-helix transcriptional regulator [Clostridium estertheticum subsp. l
MKILSTGEKIKRSRIYKGYTLKEICDDKISVSKMSCIENNKVIAEPWVLELISKELDIDLGYLNENIFEQVKENIAILKANVKNDENIATKDEDYKTNVSYNLEVAEKYNYYDLAIELMHMLFNFYLDKKDFENTQAVTSKYYDLYLKTSRDDNKLTYYIDMARHLYIKEDFLEASSYYRNVRKGLYNSEILNYKKIIIVTYNEAACNIKLENYERAFEVGKRLLDLVKHVDTDLRAAQIYHMLAILSIRMKNGDFQKYEQKSYELYKDKLSYKAMAIFNYGSTMFDCNMKEKAIDYISQGLSVYPRDDKVGLVEFMLNCVEELIKNDVVELAQNISDEVLNYAINLDDIKFIEKSYYYKAIILDRQGSSSSAEMYMNLSLDSLLKFGNKKDIYARYLEMGSMYHKLSNVADSIKYFSLALQLEKRM